MSWARGRVNGEPGCMFLQMTRVGCSGRGRGAAGACAWGKPHAAPKEKSDQPEGNSECRGGRVSGGGRRFWNWERFLVATNPPGTLGAGGDFLSCGPGLAPG